MLCDKCSNVHFRSLQKCNLPEKLLPERLRGVSHDRGDSVYYFHHENRSELEKSADSGCDFCVMLWTRLSNPDACYNTNPAKFAGDQIYFRRPWSARWTKPKTARMESSPANSDLFIVHCEAYYITGTLTMICEVNDTIENAASYQDPNLSLENDTLTISAANLKLAGRWLQNCTDNHSQCSTYSQSSLLPRRVIDITNPTSPHLRPGDSQLGQYVTLSYKWGKSKKFHTTTKNYQELLKEIPLQQLPQTFEEAIRVTYSLGYQYLWIDALCIIQDSENDLQHEIGSMDNIYRSSSLTLFAASGDDTDAGLSVFRDPRANRPCKLDIKITANEYTSQVSAYVTLFRGGLENCPLYQRGWVLPEEILSPRALVFGSWQISWWCLCAALSEEQPTVSSIQSSKGEPTGRKIHNAASSGLFCHLRSWLHEQNLLLPRNSWQRDSPFDAWYEMVAVYTLRSLTFPSDILPALSGLASAIAHKYSCTYMAGLWEEDVQGGLVWFVAKENEGIERATIIEPSSLPSWSWASQWGKSIRFRGWEDAAAQVTTAGLVLVSGDEKPATEVPNPFAIVQNNRIRLSGRLREAVVVAEQEFRDLRPMASFMGDEEWKDTVDPHEWHPVGFEHNHLKLSRWTASVVDPETGRQIGNISLDSDPATTAVDRISCLLCTVTQTWEHIRLTCLALVPTDKSNYEYRRVGLIFLREDQEGWFGELNVDKDLSYATARSRSTERKQLANSKYQVSVTIT